jgi:HD-GYP domain-containing protein (c-di-GMP phosphodiesterase class II)
MPHSKFLMNLSFIIVDNNEDVREKFKSYVNDHGGNCCVSDDYTHAISLIEIQQFDVAICDIGLSNGVTYLDFVDQAHAIDSEITIILSTQDEIDNLSIGTVIKKDVYSILRKPFDPVPLGLILLQASKSSKIARRNVYIANNLRNKILVAQKDRDRIFLNTLTSLISALEQKDEYTKNHSEEVSKLAEKICLEYSDSEEFLEDVVIAAKLHDIGKIGIRDEILFKKARLSEEEFDQIKKHPELSYKIVKPIDPSGKIGEYILHHHEKWGGTGYPYKLKEKLIPAGARILSVADVYNALTTNRPYRREKNSEEALKELVSGKNIDFDPEIVDILYKIIKTGK